MFFPILTNQMPDNFELSRLALIATTRNAVLFLLSRRRDKKTAEPNHSNNQENGSEKAKDAEADGCGLAPEGLALERGRQVIIR